MNYAGPQNLEGGEIKLFRDANIRWKRVGRGRGYDSLSEVRSERGLSVKSFRSLSEALYNRLEGNWGKAAQSAGPQGFAERKNWLEAVQNLPSNPDKNFFDVPDVDYRFSVPQTENQSQKSSESLESYVPHSIKSDTIYNKPAISNCPPYLPPKQTQTIETNVQFSKAQNPDFAYIKNGGQPAKRIVIGQSTQASTAQLIRPSTGITSLTTQQSSQVIKQASQLNGGAFNGISSASTRTINGGVNLSSFGNSSSKGVTVTKKVVGGGQSQVISNGVVTGSSIQKSQIFSQPNLVSALLSPPSSSSSTYKGKIEIPQQALPQNILQRSGSKRFTINN